MKMPVFVFIILLSHLLLQTAAEDPEQPRKLVTVTTVSGLITGVQQDSYNEFLGIPFAKPPIESLRFQPPQPVTEYLDFQATSHGNECPQIGFFGDDAGKLIGEEDCLNLNVYVPSSKSDKPRAVMFWIHGGGFQSGSAQSYHPLNLLREDVIVVLTNYRLGGLGFLTFGNDVVSGNMGLRDQIEALKWVQKHIRDFGGDPARVTIFGESAGGMSVSALYQSPLAAGLFSGAIAQSGTMLIYKSIAEVSRPWRSTQLTAKSLGCDKDELGPATLACLQALPFADIIMATQPVMDTSSELYTANPNMNPTSDYYSANPVLPFNSFEALLGKHFSTVPLMTGTVTHEGALFVGMSHMFGDFDTFLRHFPASFGLAASLNRSEISSAEMREFDILHQFYTQRSNNMSISAVEFSAMFSDLFFDNPALRTAELVAEQSDVYSYQYTHQSDNTFCKVFGFSDKTFVPIHGDELLFEFAFDKSHKFTSVFPDALNFDKQDEAVIDAIAKYWTQFAKYGNPSPPGIGSNLPVWTKFGKEKNYLELKAEPEMKNELNPSRNLLIQRIINDPREAMAREAALEKNAQYKFTKTEL